MAKGDWAPGTTLRPVMVNITLDATGSIDHVGIGYDVLLPSGAVGRQSAFTWHSPKGNYAQAPAAQVAALTAVMKRLLAAAADAEGVSLT